MFISSASVNYNVAEQIRTMLEGGGISCWIATRDILPGAVWAEEIMSALEAARTVIVVFFAAADLAPLFLPAGEQQRGLRSFLPLEPIGTGPNPTAVLSSEKGTI